MADESELFAMAEQWLNQREPKPFCIELGPATFERLLARCPPMDESLVDVPGRFADVPVVIVHEHGPDWLNVRRREGRAT